MLREKQDERLRQEEDEKQERIKKKREEKRIQLEVTVFEVFHFNDKILFDFFRLGNFGSYTT